MPQTFGQTDALALAVVKWLSDNEASWCCQVVAERRFQLIRELTDIPDILEPVSISVFPGGEVSDRQGISTAFSSQYAVNLFIQQRIGEADQAEAQCTLLSKLRSQLIEALKLRKFYLEDAVHPVRDVFLSQIKSADTGLYNLRRLLEERVFESDTILIFKAAV